MRYRSKPIIIQVLLSYSVASAQSTPIRVGQLPQSSYPVQSVQFVSNKDGWAFGDKLWSTNNGGVNWDLVNLPLPLLGGGHFDSTQDGWIVAAAEDGSGGRLFRTHDGGKTWIKQPPLPDYEIIDFLPGGQEGWVGGAQLGNPPPRLAITPACISPPDPTRLEPEIFHTNDGGIHWSKQVIPAKGGCPISLISFRDPMHGLATSGHRIYYSRNGGAAWHLATYSRTCRNREWVDDEWKENVRAFFYNNNLGWLGSESGYLLKTEDGGATWCGLKDAGEIASGGGLGEFGALYFDSPEHGWILGVDHHIHETTDGGVNWLQVQSDVRFHSLFCLNKRCWAVSRDLYRIDP